jgi:hypothetical protein
MARSRSRLSVGKVLLVGVNVIFVVILLKRNFDTTSGSSVPERSVDAGAALRGATAADGGNSGGSSAAVVKSSGRRELALPDDDYFLTKAEDANYALRDAEARRAGGATVYDKQWAALRASRRWPNIRKTFDENGVEPFKRLNMVRSLDA